MPITCALLGFISAIAMVLYVKKDVYSARYLGKMYFRHQYLKPAKLRDVLWNGDGSCSGLCALAPAGQHVLVPLDQAFLSQLPARQEGEIAWDIPCALRYTPTHNGVVCALAPASDALRGEIHSGPARDAIIDADKAEEISRKIEIISKIRLGMLVASGCLLAFLPNLSLLFSSAVMWSSWAFVPFSNCTNPGNNSIINHIDFTQTAEKDSACPENYQDWSDTQRFIYDLERRLAASPLGTDEDGGSTESAMSPDAPLAVCQNCGCVMDMGWSFCPWCGFKKEKEPGRPASDETEAPGLGEILIQQELDTCQPVPETVAGAKQTTNSRQRNKRNQRQRRMPEINDPLLEKIAERQTPV